LGLAYLIIGAIGNSTSRVSIPSNAEAYTQSKEYYDKKAEEKHTRLPQSQWNKIVVAAIRQHCPIEGMTKDEAQKALGNPISTSATTSYVGEEKASVLGRGETWHDERTTQGKCLRYEGDNCAEYETEKETATFYLSPNGYLIYPFIGGWLSLNCYDNSFSSYRSQLPD
jgi:hypothetical protein